MVGPSQPTHRYLTLCSCALHSLFSCFWQHSTMFKWVNDSVTNISAEENHFYHCSMWKLQSANSKYQVHEVLEAERTNLEPLYAWCSRQNSQQLHNTSWHRNYTNVFWLIDQSASWENLVYSRWWVNPWPCSLPVVTKLRQNNNKQMFPYNHNRWCSMTWIMFKHRDKLNPDQGQIKSRLSYLSVSFYLPLSAERNS